MTRIRSGKATPARATQRGYALILMLVLVSLGVLYGVLSGVGDVEKKVERSQQTSAALVQAREALIGYAIRYRETFPDRMYGYLPLPDLGSSRNNNNDPNCLNGVVSLEGCDANNPSGITYDVNGIGPTFIGRLPWRTLGVDPIRDGNDECLWLIVSALHRRTNRPTPPPVLPPMNWDTLGQLDIVTANGTAALVSALAGAHDRPVAVIFSPGPPLPGQNRGPSATGDDVRECGGNYDARNYLDPVLATALGGVTNYLAGSGATNSASEFTGDSDPANDPDAPKALSSAGKVFADGGNLVPDACQGNNCALVSNDFGLPLSSAELFAAIRKSSNFRTDINAMLDRMTLCLRDRFAAGISFTPAPIPGYTAPVDKTAGRIPDDTCYNDSTHPINYFSHYRDMFFVAQPNSGTFTITDRRSGISDANCAGVLVFSGQRATTQQRVTALEKSTISNYLEGNNLSSFTNPGTAFTGDVFLERLDGPGPLPQTGEQDIVRCIPDSASVTENPSSPLATLGLGQLVAYDAASQTLTLGRENLTTGAGVPAAALYGCAWLTNIVAMENGLRAYFTFQFKRVGTNVGTNGFVFAIADAEANSLAACGAAGSHLGYSGDNGETPRINAPKIGIEFDQSRNTGFTENPLNPGRRDPCGVTGCGGSFGYNTHAAVVYWGHDAANAIDGVTRPDNDDNAHGFPSLASLPTATRPPPQNPDFTPPGTPPTGVAFKDLRGRAALGGDSFLYHVRVEITPTRNVDAAAAELSNTSVRTEVWVEGNANAVNQIATLKNTTRPMSQLYPGYVSTLINTAVIYDVAGVACSTSSDCPLLEPGGTEHQPCGSDNICYRPAMNTLQIGFTNSQRTTDQEITIGNYFMTQVQ